jgi:hypothetical protein
VEDLLKDIGLKAAEQLPGTLAFSAAALVIIGWIGYHVWEEVEQPGKGLMLSVLGGAALAVVIGLPSSYAVARDQCRQEYENASRTYPAEIGGFSYEADLKFTYKYSKCANVWPNGP